MAKIKNNILTKGISGSTSNTIVYKTRNGKTFASKYPDMSKAKPTYAVVSVIKVEKF